MSTPREAPLAATVSLVGAAVWAALATLAGLHRAPLGIIELMFLFAPLVIVPLGLELAYRLEDPPRARPGRLFQAFQAVAAASVCIAFWIPPGRASGILSSLWLILCILLAGSRVAERRSAPSSLLSFVLDLAHADLILGAAWLVLSRAGWRPLGFQEPIILLTGVHFHYSGFSTAVIAATAIYVLVRKGFNIRELRTIVLLVVLLPFVVAAGFVFSPLLRFVAAIALAVVVTTLAGILLWFAGRLNSVTARIYLRAAACAAFAALALVGVYAVSEYFRKDWITVPGMANSHGILNGLGFVLLATLGWLTELHGTEIYDTHLQTPALSSDPARLRWSGEKPHARHKDGHGGSAPSPLPEFVARDFYDR